MAGHYGFGNTGDEAILSAILSDFRAQRNAFEFIVVSFNSQATAEMHHVRSIHWKDIQGLLEAAKQSDLIMIGGGGVFVDYWGVPTGAQLTEHHWGISYYNAIGLLSVLFNKPFIINSVGVGPLLTEEGKRLTRQTFEIADLITVRDEMSRNVLKSIGVPIKKIRVTADPALGLTTREDSLFDIFQTAGIDLEKQPVLGVCVRHWEDSSKSRKWKLELAAGLDQFLEVYNDARAVFIPFQMEKHQLENDQMAAKEIRSLMRHFDKTHLLSGTHSPEIVKGLLSHCRAVVGMRLHSLIFAAGAGVPMVALSYDPKVAGFMDLLGLSACAVDLNSVNAENLFAMLDLIWAKPDPIRKQLSKRTITLKKHHQRVIKATLHLLSVSVKDSCDNRPSEIELLREFAIKKTIDLVNMEKKLQSSFRQKVRRIANAKTLRLLERLSKIRDNLLHRSGDL